MLATYRHAMAVVVAGSMAALGGCAMMEGGTGPGSQAPERAAMGGGSSSFTRAAHQPFSVSECMKFEATPYECERILLRGE